VHLVPDFFQALDEVMTEAWREENRRPAVSAGGDELQFTRAVSAMVDRHAAFKYTRGDGGEEGARSGARSGVSLRDIADPTKRGLRQPALRTCELIHGWTDLFHAKARSTQRSQRKERTSPLCLFAALSVSAVAQGANFIAPREEMQILRFAQNDISRRGGPRMTCHSERSEESAFGCGYAAPQFADKVVECSRHWVRGVGRQRRQAMPSVAALRFG